MVRHEVVSGTFSVTHCPACVVGVIAGSASGAPSSIVDALRKIANECRDALSRVSEAEDRIARDSGLNSLSSSYRELGLRHAELQSQCVTTAGEYL